MKYLLVIGDGMADNPFLSKGGTQTALEAAHIPTIDRLCREGKSGWVQTVPPGCAPGSDTAILNIFGYDPRRYYSGRSPLEAAGLGRLCRPGEVTYRCNMVSLGEPYPQGNILSHNAGGIEGADAEMLMHDLLADPTFDALCKKYQFSFVVTDTFRHIAIQNRADVDSTPCDHPRTAPHDGRSTDSVLPSGKTSLPRTSPSGACEREATAERRQGQDDAVAASCSASAAHCFPPHDHLGESAALYLPKGEAAAPLIALQDAAHAFLSMHLINNIFFALGKRPANGIWFWAEGTGIELPDHAARYNKRGAVISAVPLLHGIANLCGVEVLHVPGATGELNTAYEAKADAALGALADGRDFVVLHVEAPDECTHNGDTSGKLQAIEWIDSRCLARFLEKFPFDREELRVLILSDHKTLTATRGHDGDPVPYLLWDSRGVQPDDPGATGNVYTEATTANGGLIAEGDRLIGMLLETAYHA